MAKVDVDVVAAILNDSNVDPELVDRIMRRIQNELKLQEEMAEASREPRIKNQYVILLSDPLKQVKAEDLVGWVLQIPETASPATIMGRITRAAREFNSSPKGRKFPAESIGEACEVVGPKFLRPEQLSIRTRLPVTVIKTDNRMPEDKGKTISLSDLKG